MARESETHWGRIAFGVGIVTCVIAGAAVGVILGSGKDDGGSGALQRVAALALDTRGLNDDALALSRAIEEAIEREELEGEAERLRVRLALLEERAARIQARARLQPVSSQEGERGPNAAERRWARNGLSEVRSAVAIFESEVAGGLDEALASSSSSTATSALAQATAVAQQQSAKMTELSKNASRVEQPEAGEEVPQVAVDPAETSPELHGSFAVVPSPEGESLDADYELAEIEAGAEESGEVAGEWEVTATAGGALSIGSPMQGSEAVSVPPLLMVFLWDESELPQVVRDDARFELGDEEWGAEGETDTAPFSCRYELRGRRYCVLTAFAFGEPEGDPARLEPGEEVDLGSPTPAGILRLDAGGDAVATAVAELLGTQEPALVQVVEAGPEHLFQAACETAPAEQGEAVETEEIEMPEAGSTETEGAEAEAELGATVALLDGDGSAIFAAEPLTEVPVPACFEVAQ